MLFYAETTSGQENHFIMIEHDRIGIRYSRREDVENILGQPESVHFFENGGEDFFWNNFTVCSYSGGKLSFHYSQNSFVIRITVDASYFKNIFFMKHDIRFLTKENILREMVNLEENSIVSSETFVSFSARQNMNNAICYSFWFDEDGKTRWVDMYYIKPW